MYTLRVQIPSNETTGACPALVRLISVIPICASLILVSGVTKTTTRWLSLLTTAPAANPDSQTRAPTPLPPPLRGTYGLCQSSADSCPPSHRITVADSCREPQGHRQGSKARTGCKRGGRNFQFYLILTDSSN